MRLRSTLAAGLLIAATLGVTGVASGEGAISARMSTGSQLPFRSVIVSMPEETTLTADSVSVFENGDRVPKFDLIPATATDARQFGVVLVIDTSRSMHGQPAVQAFAAARTFAEKVAGAARLGVVGFNHQPTVIAPLTDDAAQVEATLADPPSLELGTHIYDGVTTAVQMLQAAKIRAGTVVVLSDGADTGSDVTEKKAVAAAQKAGVTVYTVGLRSKAFDRSALERLAAAGKGTYSEADSPAGLEAVYARLGGQLANQYIVRYRTDQPADTQVKVAVKVDGYGVAETGYEIPPGKVGAPFHRNPLEEFLRSIGGMLLAVAAGAALIGVAAGLFVKPRRNTVRQRIGEFVHLDGGERSGSTPMLSSRLYAGAERSLAKAGWWSRLKQDMELAEMDVNPAQLLAATMLGAVITGWLLAALTGYAFVGLLGLAVLMVPRSIVASKVRKRRMAFSEQLPDNLQVMASAMRAGHSFIGALAVVVDDSPEPSASEFRRVVADEQFGVPLEDALRSVVERMDNRDLAQVALVAALQRETGGNTAEVLERVTETIRERFELRRLVKTLTAQGRMSRWVVSALPVGLLLIITAINPQYMKPLFEHPIGRLLLVAAAVLVVGGSLVIKRIVNIKV
jgi:tight adherence protein B